MNNKIIGPYHIGKTYFIRTVTHHYTGVLVKVFKNELVLKDAAWIADDGRFADAVKDGTFSEVEPFPDGEVVIGRGAICDAYAVTFKSPRIQK
jgi:hypothetical protein